MNQLIEVEFKGNRREFFLWDAPDLPPAKAPIIVEADRGEDLGHVHAVGDFAAKRNAGVPHGTGGGAPERRALRLASVDDLRRAEDLREQDELARRRAMERVKANGLVMKLSDAEWQWDRRKLTFFFTAEKRVDFRALVRDLAALFRTRIELKQIGVRDEAKRLSGVGRCAREYCSASWLPELRPVNLGVAKDQRLSLNPSQISGACGRLMCCLRYEHEFYVHARKRFPKEGRIVMMAQGEEKIIANDIFRDRVTLRNAEGDTRVVTLLDFRTELAERSGEPVPEVLDNTPPENDEPPPSRGRIPERRVMTRRAHDEIVAFAAEELEDPEVIEELDADEVEVEEPGTTAVEAGATDDRRPRRRRGRRGGRRARRGQLPGETDTPAAETPPDGAE